jgi:hypothetical protein
MLDFIEVEGLGFRVLDFIEVERESDGQRAIIV